MKINVLSALYGFGSSSDATLVDVTSQVAFMCSGDVTADIKIWIDPSTFKINDPANGVRKTFAIRYMTTSQEGIDSPEIIQLGVDGDTVGIVACPAGLAVPTEVVYGSGGRIYDISRFVINYLNENPSKDSFAIDSSFRKEFCYGSDFYPGVPKSLFMKMNSPDMASSDLVCVNDGENGNWNIHNPIIRILVRNRSLVGLNVFLKSSGASPQFLLGPGEYGLVECLAGDILQLDAPNIASGKTVEIDSYAKTIYYLESDIKSDQQTGVPVSVTFQNKYNFSLNVFQIDGTGRIQNYPTPLSKVGSVTLQGYPASVLKVFTSDTGQEVFVYTISTDTSQICIVGPQGKSSLPCFLQLVNTRKNNINIYFVNSDGSETLEQGSLANNEIWEKKSMVGEVWIARDSTSNDLVSFTYAISEEMTTTVHEYWPWENNVIAMQALDEIRESQFAYYPLGTITEGNDGLYRWQEGAVGPNVVFNGDGNFGYAALFTNQQSYISFAPELERYYVEDSYSLSCWVKVHGLPAGTDLAVIVGSLRIDSNGDIQYGFPYMNTSGGEILEYNVPFPAVVRLQQGQWQSIVLAYDSGSKICSIYLDGINHGYATIPDDIADKEILLPTNPGIGGSATVQSGLTYFYGEISDVGFFDIACGDDHALVLANRDDQFQDKNRELTAVILILLPIAVAALLIILVTIATSAKDVTETESIDPDYVKNRKLLPYNGQNIKLLDIWGEGRVSYGDTVAGFPDAYNFNKEGMRVYIGANMGMRKIPNFIEVSSYTVGFDGKIKENSVKVMVSMNSPLENTMSNDMLKCLDQKEGVVLLYSIDDKYRNIFEKALVQYKDDEGNQIFTRKEKNSGNPITAIDLPGEYGKIRNKVKIEDNIVCVYGPRELTLGQVVNDLLREQNGDL